MSTTINGSAAAPSATPSLTVPSPGGDTDAWGTVLNSSSLQGLLDYVAWLYANGYFTAADLLTAIKTVDGTGSGLDADTLDGSEATAFALLTGAAFTGALTVSGNTVWHDGNTALRVATGDLQDGSVTTAKIADADVTQAKLAKAPDTGLGTTGTLTLDASLSTGLYDIGALTGNVTFASSNLAAGRSITARVVNGGTLRTLSFPAGWTFVGDKPTDIAASKTGVLTITSFGTTDADVVAAWAVEA